MIRFSKFFLWVIFIALLSTVHATAFDPSDLAKLKETKRCPGCDLSRAKLTDADLAGATWTNGCRCTDNVCSNCK